MFFSKFNVNKVEWLNLVFENRNQSYGAYALRLHSGEYLRNALVISMLFLGLLVLIPSIYFRSKTEVRVVTPVMDSKPMEDVVFILPSKPETPVEKTNTKAGSDLSVSKATFNQIDYSKPNVVPDHLVTREIPTQEMINTSIISNTDVKGENAGTGNAAVVNSTGNGSGDGLGLEGGDSPYNIGNISRMPEFPGGMSAWSKFLNKNLRYPEVARTNNISGNVIVSFIIERNGELTDLKILKGIGGGCDEEALRVIKKSPFWKPGYQGDKPVRVSYVIPIVFYLEQ